MSDTNPRTSPAPRAAPADPRRDMRCCVLGVEDGRIRRPVDDVKIDLENAILAVIREGHTTLVTGVHMGSEIWAGEIFIRLMSTTPSLHLVVACPWPGMEEEYPDSWTGRCRRLMACADYVKYFRPRACPEGEQLCTGWMITRSSRMIAVSREDDFRLRTALDRARRCTVPMTVLQG